MSPPVPDSLRPKVGDREAGLLPPHGVDVAPNLYGHLDMIDLPRINHPRAREIVRDYDQWVAGKNRAYEQAYQQEGVEDDGPDQLSDEMHAVIKRINATPAPTIRWPAD